MTELPKEPGYYIDIDGDPWQLREYEPGKYQWVFGDSIHTSNYAELFAPFERLYLAEDIDI